MHIILAKQAFQFGLLGHLDILLLVNKQWGAFTGGTFTYPVSINTLLYASMSWQYNQPDAAAPGYYAILSSNNTSFSTSSTNYARFAIVVAK